MGDFQINDHLLQTECDSLAQEIFDEFKAEGGEGWNPEDDRDEMSDRAHETADGHEWVIYTYKAHMLCAHCDTTKGEELLEDVGMPEDPTYDKLGSFIAFGEMRGRIEEKLSELIEEYEPEESDDEAAA